MRNLKVKVRGRGWLFILWFIDLNLSILGDYSPAEILLLQWVLLGSDNAQVAVTVTAKLFF